jgi:acyl-CoA thioester hydrolase
MTPYVKDDAFYFPLRIYYEDTDAGGVVYHSNYLNFCERARTEWLRVIGVGRERLQNEFGLMFVVRRASIDYRRPARLDDKLVIETRLSGMGKVRMSLRQTVKRDEVVLAIADIEVVAINMEFVPTALPEALIASLPATAPMEEKH